MTSIPGCSAENISSTSIVSAAAYSSRRASKTACVPSSIRQAARTCG